MCDTYVPAVPSPLLIPPAPTPTRVRVALCPRNKLACAAAGGRVRREELASYGYGAGGVHPAPSHRVVS